MVQDSAASSLIFYANSVFLFAPLTWIPTTPPSFFKEEWFRLFPFRSPLLRESLLLSFPPATEMFQFTGFALPDLWIQSGVTHR